jgi:hypothetical protein
MAHRKRVKCCRSKPRCNDCPLVAQKASKQVNQPAKKGKRK